MSTPFFLTRQTANLMEDFVAELQRGSALFLLYGDIGVGKTRLLRELSQSRLSERAIYWLEMGSNDGDDRAPMDRSSEIEALFAAAGQGDIIIADHFEIALKKSRHQLILSWSTDGVDKQVSLIIASSTEGFDELRQLAHQYQVRVQSFQLMPFGADEVQAFLGFYLFPDQPPGKLAMPAPLSRQIVATQGVVGRLIEIAQREGSQIQSSAQAPTESTRRGGGIILALLFLVVLVTGVGWYLFARPEAGEFSAPVTTAPDSARDPPAAAADGQGIEPLDQPGAAIATRTATVAGPDAAAAGRTPAVIEDTVPPESEPESTRGVPVHAETATQVEAGESVAEPSALAVIEPAIQAGSGATAVVPAQTRPEVGTVPDSEAVTDVMPVIDQPVPAEAAGTDIVVESSALSPQNSRQRFDLDLSHSMEWIRQHGDSAGTIQILLLSQANFDPDNYYHYVAELARKQVDTGRLRVFKTLTGKREVYSVVYGDYASRKQALDAIGSLPDVLRDTAPLARSIGGLWQEIRRLESKN